MTTIKRTVLSQSRLEKTVRQENLCVTGLVIRHVITGTVGFSDRIDFTVPGMP